jgi:hypothetical protein
MYDYMERFCTIAAKGASEEDPLILSRLIGQLEILAEMCSSNYKLEGLCETLANEMLKLQEKLDKLVKPPEPKTVYKQEYVRCGKENCNKCAHQQWHGPYWYAYKFAEGQSKKRYIGLKLPEGLKEGQAEVRYATPLATTEPCRQKCALDNGEIKEPCCKLEFTNNKSTEYTENIKL